MSFGCSSGVLSRALKELFHICTKRVAQLIESTDRCSSRGRFVPMCGSHRLGLGYNPVCCLFLALWQVELAVYDQHCRGLGWGELLRGCRHSAPRSVQQHRCYCLTDLQCAAQRGTHKLLAACIVCMGRDCFAFVSVCLFLQCAALSTALGAGSPQAVAMEHAVGDLERFQSRTSLQVMFDSLSL